MNLFGSWPQMNSTGEAILFWCVALFMVACALGVLFLKKAAYNAICMVGVMLGLAILYIAQGAPFLGAVQVVVYTGAIMMLFLFVIMMIGLGASDEYRRQRRGNIVGAVLLSLGLAVVLVGIVGHSSITAVDAPAVDPYSDEPVTSLATELFSNHWFSMELAGALLITAAIGAMLLTHTDRLSPKVDQKATAHAKMRAFRESGRRLGQLPAPGVYATTNAADVPAIAGDTMSPIEESIPRVLRVRGLTRTLSQVEPDVAESLQLVRSGDAADSFFGPEASASVPRSGSWGMPGPAAPDGLGKPAEESQPTTQGGPALVDEGTTAEVDAGEPGTDHVTGAGTNAAATPHKGEEK